MRICFFLFLLVCQSASAQLKEINAKNVDREMVRLTDTLYVCRTEVINMEYRFFLSAIAAIDSMQYHLYKVDSSGWRDQEWNGSMEAYYHRHPGFRDYPVLNISYEAANAYCRWLTELYNKDASRQYNKVRFDLPDEKEWEQAARGGKSDIVYPWGTNSLRETRTKKWQGTFMANFRRIGEVDIVSDEKGNPKFGSPDSLAETITGGLHDRAFYTAPVNSFFPNAIGLYNMSGNAAEMTSQKGLTKGGSWNSLGGEIRIGYRLYFKQSSPETGFRVFMKVLEK